MKLVLSGHTRDHANTIVVVVVVGCCCCCCCCYCYCCWLAEDDADVVDGRVRQSRHQGPRKEPLMKLVLGVSTRDNGACCSKHSVFRLSLNTNHFSLNVIFQ